MTYKNYPIANFHMMPELSQFFMFLNEDIISYHDLKSTMPEQRIV